MKSPQEGAGDYFSLVLGDGFLLCVRLEFFQLTAIRLPPAGGQYMCKIPETGKFHIPLSRKVKKLQKLQKLPFPCLRGVSDFSNKKNLGS